MTLTLYGHRPARGLCRAQQGFKTVFSSFYGSRARWLFGRVVFLLLLCCSMQQPASANDITVSAVTFPPATISGSGADATVAVNFRLQWSNSWRVSTGPSNWDAAWVFIKYRIGTTDPQLTNITTSGTSFTVSNTNWLRVGMPVRVTSGTGAFPDGTVITAISGTTVTVSSSPSPALSGATVTCSRIWEHAKLANTGHTAASGSTITMGLQDPASAWNGDSNPALGAFIYRDADGSGSNNWLTTLRWNIGRGGRGAVDVRVFAVEMVYVPQGNFYLGDGDLEGNANFQKGDVNAPFLIQNENSLTLGGTDAANLNNNNPTPRGSGNSGTQEN